MLSEGLRRTLHAHRVARLATADAAGHPHVVPVCFAADAGGVYITVDAKPKHRTGRELKRIRNIRANPHVALTVDHWDEDWTRLAWTMLRGRAEILEAGVEHDAAQALLRERYVQYRDMDLSALPVIAIRVAQVTGWRAT